MLTRYTGPLTIMNKKKLSHISYLFGDTGKPFVSVVRNYNGNEMKFYWNVTPASVRRLTDCIVGLVYADKWRAFPHEKGWSAHPKRFQ